MYYLHFRCYKTEAKDHTYCKEWRNLCYCTIVSYVNFSRKLKALNEPAILK